MYEKLTTITSVTLAEIFKQEHRHTMARLRRGFARHGRSLFDYSRKYKGPSGRSFICYEMTAEDMYTLSDKITDKQRRAINEYFQLPSTLLAASQVQYVLPFNAVAHKSVKRDWLQTAFFGNETRSPA